MGLMSSKIEMNVLKPGDHIYTWRSGYSYSHHGIYVEDEKVIHLTRGPGPLISSSSESQASGDRVECCNIQDFRCDGQLYRFEYGVSKSLFLIKRAGTCSLASSNPPEQVLHNASYLLEYGYGNYNLLNKNCEDFALYCKTSIVKVRINFSGQINSLLAASFAITIIPYHFLPATLLGVVVCGLYCFLRLTTDVGWQTSGSAVVVVEELDLSSDEHNGRENMNMMEKSTTRWLLRPEYYIAHTIVAIRCWYWTPETKILVWFKTRFCYSILSFFVSNHLRLHGFKLGEYSAYTIWLLGHLYWRWTSVSTFLLWTRSFFLYEFVLRFVSDAPRQLKLRNYVAHAMLLFLVWCWTPRIIILQWIKLALVYKFLFLFISNHLRNHRLVRWEAFFVCFVVQSLALFLGPDYSDYIFRITKITFV